MVLLVQGQAVRDLKITWNWKKGDQGSLMFPFYPMKALARYVLQDQVFELGKGERESIRFEIIYDYS